MVKNSFIEKTYVVGTHWNVNLQNNVTENKEEIYLERSCSDKAYIFPS